jgi:hypothetical protein
MHDVTITYDVLAFKDLKTSSFYQFMVRNVRFVESLNSSLRAFAWSDWLVRPVHHSEHCTRTINHTQMRTISDGNTTQPNRRTTAMR